MTRWFCKKQNRIFYKMWKQFWNYYFKNIYNDNDQEILVIKVQVNSFESIIYLKTFIKDFEEFYKHNYGENIKKSCFYNSYCKGIFFK